MSAPNATATWFPALDGLKLPRALVQAIQQAFSLIYSLRDSLTQLRAQVSALTSVTSLSPGDLTGAVILAAGLNITLSQAGQTITIAAAGGGGQTPWASDIDAAGHNLLNADTLNATYFHMSGLLESSVFGVMIDTGGDATFRNLAVGPSPPGVTVIDSAGQFVGPAGVATPGAVNAAGFGTAGQTGQSGVFRITAADGVTIRTVTFTNGIMTSIV